MWQAIKDWIRALLWGKCPICGSINLVQVEGWRRIECQDCHYHWPTL